MKETSQRGWISRNWGCVIVLAIAAPVLLCGGCFTSVFMIAFGAMKSSTPYQETVARAEANAEVKQLLGAPVEPGWYVLGNFEIQNDAGQADLQIPISGPKGSAMISVAATKTAGVWSYSRMLVSSPELAQPIDLLSGKSG